MKTEGSGEKQSKATLLRCISVFANAAKGQLWGLFYSGIIFRHPHGTRHPHNITVYAILKFYYLISFYRNFDRWKLLELKFKWTRFYSDIHLDNFGWQFSKFILEYIVF